MVENKRLAVQALQNAQFEKVHELLGTAENLKHNKDAIVAYIVGVSYFHQRSDDNAEKMLRQCLEFDPNNIDAAGKLINLMGGIGRHDKALEICLKFPNSLSNNNAAFCCLSSILLSGRLRDLDNLWEALKQNISSAYVTTEVGFIFYLLKDMEVSGHCFLNVKPAVDDSVVAAKAIFYFLKTTKKETSNEILEEQRSFFGDAVNGSWLTY